MKRISAIFSLMPLFALVLILSFHPPVSDPGPGIGNSAGPAGLYQGSPGEIWESALGPNGAIDILPAYLSLTGPRDTSTLIPARQYIRSAESVSLIGVSSEPSAENPAGDSVPSPPRLVENNPGPVPMSGESIQVGGRQTATGSPGSPQDPPELPLPVPEPDPIPAPVPEPSGLILSLTGFFILIQRGRRRKR